MDGKPLQIITAEEDHTFTLEEENLASILLRDDVRRLKCAVISVAGAFRKGKSFLLNFFLKYLTAQGSESWLGSDEEPLQGFSWRGGSERETSGILMWSEPFICKDKSGEEVAVLLMDTQGAFDTQSTVRDCATVFALSTMLASVQVYNLSQNIQEDDLQHLQLFTEYGRLALSEDADQAPFQSLVFLVRDWAYPYEAAYGTKGGLDLLDRRLQITDKQHPELQQLRQHIRSCFSSTQCFLMPHPGLRVATSPAFKGALSDIETDFKTVLQDLVPLILGADSLVVKNISGNDVTCCDLLQFFKAYIGIFSGDELPEPRSMLQATAEANNLSAVAKAKDKYTAMMEKVCGGDQPYLHPNSLDMEHLRCKEAAQELFRSIKKMGGAEFSARFAEGLEKDIDTQYESLKEHNDSKNIFAAARTPATLLTLMVGCYLLSGIFDLVGLTSLSSLLTACLGLCLAMIILWAYVRYSGEQRDLGMHVDNFAEFVWEKLLREVYTRVTQRGVQLAMSGGIQRQPSRPHQD